MKMKALVIAAMLLAWVAPLQAQDIRDEAMASLETAGSFVKNGNYKKAIEEINYALAKINELTAAELINFIPDAPKGFTLVSKQSQGIGAEATIAGSAGATAQYTDSKGAKIDVTIALGGMTGKIASFAALGSIFAGMSQDAGLGQTRKVRVQGYTGTEMYNAEEQSGNLSFQVGDETSVTINGEQIESAETLMELAKAFDFAGLEKSF